MGKVYINRMQKKMDLYKGFRVDGTYNIKNLYREDASFGMIYHAGMDMVIPTKRIYVDIYFKEEDLYRDPGPGGIGVD